MSVLHDDVPGAERNRLEEARSLANAGRQVEAESLFQQLASGPLASEALDGLGVLQMRAGDLATAISSFKQALARNPRNVDALYHLASLAERQGSAEIARGLYEMMNAARAATEPLDPRPTVRSPAGLPDRPIQQAVEPATEFGVWEIILHDPAPLAHKIMATMNNVAMTVHPRIGAYLSRLLVLTLLLTGISYGLQLGASPLASALRMVPLTSFRPVSLGQTLLATGCVVLILGVVYVRSVTVTLARGRIQVQHGIFTRSFKNHEIWRVDDVRVHSGWIQQLTGDGTLTLELVYAGGRRELVEVPGIAPVARLKIIAQELLDLSFSLRAHNAVKGIPAY